MSALDTYIKLACMLFGAFIGTGAGWFMNALLTAIREDRKARNSDECINS